MNQAQNFRRGSRRRVEYTDLNSGFKEMNLPAETENVEDTQVALETALVEKSKHQKESENQ